jgi:hypothetical protein
LWKILTELRWFKGGVKWSKGGKMDQSTLNQPIVVVALVGAIYALVKGIEHLVQKKNGTNSVNFSEKDRQMLSTLYLQHDQKDKNGTPLWYVPRSMVEGQKVLIEKLNEMVLMQKTAIGELKEMNQNFANWEPVRKRPGERG